MWGHTMGVGFVTNNLLYCVMHVQSTLAYCSFTIYMNDYIVNTLPLCVSWDLCNITQLYVHV